MTSRASLLAVALVLALSPGAEAARRERQSTLADLAARSAPVNPGPVTGVDASLAVRSYREFLEIDSADPALRAQALRRLGDLCLARAEALRAEDGAPAGEAAAATEEALVAYSRLLREYPTDAHADEVLYQLARAHDGIGQAAQAMTVLDRLVSEHPATRHYAEAQFRRGEMFFAAGRYPDAETAFASVLRTGESSGFYLAALYKHGWSLFKQSRDQDGSESFLTLLDALLARQELSRPEREMADDALRALSIGFADQDGLQSLQAAAARHGTVSYESQLYGALGDLYLEKERYQDAAAAYREFARRRPEDPGAPLLLVRALDAYSQGGFTSLVLDGKRELAGLYGPRSVYWRSRSGQLDPQVASVVESTILDLARHHHAATQRDGSRADLEQSVDWYRHYLEGFDSSLRAPGTRLLLADLLFENGRYLEAAVDYEAAAYGYQGHAEAGRAGYAALVAYQKASDALPAPQQAALEQRALDSALRFTETFPERAEVPAVLAATSQRLFESGDRARAERVANRLLELGPRADAAQQRVAWSVLANTYFDDGRYLEAEAAFRELGSRLPPGDPEAQQVADRLAAAVYRQAELRQAAGDLSGAVDEFLRVATVAPASSIRVNAEFDAATLLLQAAEWDRAIEVMLAFRRGHPGHELQPEITRKLAAAYLEGGRHLEAAAELEAVAARQQEPPELRRTALWQAAELYATADAHAAARRSYENYVRDFPQPLEAAQEARRTLAELAGADGDLVARSKWLEQLVAADAAGGAQRTDRSRFLAAQASLELAQQADHAARAVRLVVPLERSLRDKKQALERALGAYGRAADYGVAGVSTAASFAMAELYLELARSLMESERPRGLTAEELEQYELLLEEQAFPFEEKAIEIHVANAGHAAAGAYDEWVERSFGALARLAPGRYAREESALGPSAADGAPVEIAALFSSAETALGTDRAVDAAAQLEQALAADPGHAPGWNRLGIAYRRTGRFAEAQLAYERAIALDPAFVDPERNLAILLDLYLDRPEAALAHYERCELLGGGADGDVSGWLAELRSRLDRRPRTAEVHE